MNIAAAICMSFQKFLRSTENAEIHSRFFSIFSSYTRKIALELTLNPEDRKDCIDFCKACKDEYDKAVAESPSVPDSVIVLFKKNFSNEKNKPEVANGLFHFNNYKSKCETPRAHDEEIHTPFGNSHPINDKLTIVVQ